MGDDGTAQEAPRERELKLELPAEALGRVSAKLASLSGARNVRASKLSSAYFDTEQQTLRKAGVALRIRKAGRRRLQTIKHGAGGVGLFDRLEIERPARGAAPMLNAAERGAIDAILKKPLPPDVAFVPVFETEIKRKTFPIVRDGAVIEAALDVFSVVAGDRRTHYAELELELKEGEPAPLFSIARELMAEFALRLGVEAKSTRGYQLADGEDRLSVTAEGSPIRPGMSVEEAFAAVVADCVAQFRQNEALFLVAPQDAALHQGRVALRRLRSAFKLFAPILAEPRAAAIADGVRWLAQVMGEARDIDVLMGRDEVEEAETAASPAALENRLQAARALAYSKALEALRSQRALSLMIDLAEWTAIGGWRADEATVEIRRKPIEDFAIEVLDAALKKLERNARGLTKLTPEKRHRARIKAKTLRYASEFFGPLFAGGRQARFVSRLKQVQERLGELNDIATAQDIAFDISQEATLAQDAPAAFAAGRLAAKTEGGARGLVDKAAKRLKKLKKTDPFWR